MTEGDAPVDGTAEEPEKAVGILTQLFDLRTRAEAATAAAEEANRKANSESGFAYNAKLNAEGTCPDDLAGTGRR
jgi:hypothetical protein